MGLFNKLFRGAPRIGLSDEDRGAAKIADDVLSRSGHLSRSMERSGVLDPSMQKSRLFGSVALGGAVVGSGAAAHSIAFDNQNTFGNTAGGVGAGAMIGLAASVALGARRGRQGKLVGSKDAFAHASVTGQNYKPISFSDSVFGESKVLAREAKEAFENQENYSNAARMFYEQSLAKGQEPTKFQRTMSSAREHTKNAYRQVPKQFNNAKNMAGSAYTGAKNMAGSAYTGAKNKAGSVYRHIPDYLEKVHSKIDMDRDIKAYGDFSLSAMRSPLFKKFDDFVSGRKQPGPLAKGQEPTKFQRTMASAWEHTKNAKNATVNQFNNAKNKAGSVYQKIPDYLEKTGNKIDIDRDIKAYGDFSLSLMRNPHFKKFDNFVRGRKQPGPTVSSSINEKNAKKYDGVTHSAAAAKVFGNDGPIQTSTPEHLAKSSAGRKYQPTSPNFTKYSRYEDKPFMTKGEAELDKPINLKNKTQRHKSFTHTTNTLEPTGKTTRAPSPRKHKYRKPSK